jgi:hypothetical protein
MYFIKDPSDVLGDVDEAAIQEPMSTTTAMTAQLAVVDHFVPGSSVQHSAEIDLPASISTHPHVGE